METETVMMSFRISKELRRLLKEKCARCEVPVTAVITTFLEEWVKQQEEVELKQDRE